MDGRVRVFAEHEREAVLLAERKLLAFGGGSDFVLGCLLSTSAGKWPVHRRERSKRCGGNGRPGRPLFS